MSDFWISWNEESEERREGAFRDGWVAFEAAVAKARELSRPVKVVRPDGTVFTVVYPAEMVDTAPAPTYGS